MFFARFEGTAVQDETIAQQRLEALKQKIAGKQKQRDQEIECRNNVVNSLNDSNAELQHPKKRKKLSCTEETHAPKAKKKKKNKSARAQVENEAKETVMQDCKRKKKIFKPVDENMDIKVKSSGEDTTKEISGESKPKKKHKKKKTQESAETIEDNEDLTFQENRMAKKKQKKKKSKISENPLLTENNERNDVEQIEHKKKKKRKKRQKEADNISVSEDTKPESAAENGLKETNDNANTTLDDNNQKNETKNEEEDTKGAEAKEEWTILGKHKTLEKVGHVKRDLPDWIVNCEIIDSDFNNVTPISEFGLLDEVIVDVLKKMEIKSLFPVQSQIIPDVLEGCQKTTLLTRQFTPPSDLCISAPTGSGKTLVYVLSLVQCLYKLPPLLQALVVVPTKNLANQVKQVFNNFSNLIKVVLLSGKDTFPTERRRLFTDHGACLAHIAVATPGRLVNHLRETPLLTLQHLRFLVIDEMDTLLSQTYQDWLPFIFKTVYNTEPYNHPLQPVVKTLRYPHTPTLNLAELSRPALPLQKLLFSATVTHHPSKLAALHLYTPRLYSCRGKYTLPNTLVHYQIRCQLEDKALVLIHLVKKLEHVLCFTSSVETSHRLAILTEEYGGVGGIKVSEYSSTLTTQQRNKVIRDFSTGAIQLLVCSDSLARGMDLSLVDHVINYDVPAHVQTYVHRVGRTARAGKVGYAYTLVRYEEIRHFHQLLFKAGDTRAKELKIPAGVIAELSTTYQECLQRLENRLKSKSRKEVISN